MHPYATDSAERQNVRFGLAVLAILAAWGLAALIRRHNFEVGWYIDVPSVLAFYGLFHTGFDRVVWRWGRRLGIVRVPDLQGKWIGHLTTSFDQHSAQRHATVQIVQTWTRIGIALCTDTSKSHSLVSSLLTETAHGPMLS